MSLSSASFSSGSSAGCAVYEAERGGDRSFGLPAFASGSSSPVSVSRLGDSLMLMSGAFDVHRRQSVSSEYSFRSVSPVVGDGMLPALPSFVPASDVQDIAALLYAVSAGRFSGPAYAALLHRAALRCDIAERVSVCGAKAFDQLAIYNRCVELAEEDLGVRATSFGEAVAELAVTNALCSIGRRAVRTTTAPQAIASTVHCTVVGGHYAVAVPFAGGVPAVATRVVDVADDMAVVPRSVLRGLLALGVRKSGITVSISMRRRADGVFVPSEVFDAAHSYPVNALPTGFCVMPGCFGKIVPNSMLSDYLTAVLVLPALAKSEAYCYLDCLPQDMRLNAALSLGSECSASVLVAKFPACRTWSDVDAEIVEAPVLPGETIRRLHVVTAGRLPSWVRPGDVLAGLGRSESAQPRGKSAQFASQMLDDILTRAAESQASASLPSLAGSPRARSPASKPLPTVPGGSGFVSPSAVGSEFSAMGLRSRSASVSGDALDSGELVPVTRSHARYASLSAVTQVVATGQPTEVFQPEWSAFADVYAREWRMRLSGGAPVGHSVLKDLSNSARGRALPTLPPGDGVCIHIPEGVGGTFPSVIVPTWESRACPVEGWYMEDMKVRVSSKGGSKSVVLVPPLEGALCRYEITSDQSVFVGSEVVADAHHVVLWCVSPITLQFKGPAYLHRLWTASGSMSLGPAAVKLSRQFRAPALRRFDNEIRADQVVGLRLSGEDPAAGLLRYEKRVKVRSPGGRVHVYLSDESNTEPAYVQVAAPGLAAVSVYGVRVVAKSGVASFVAPAGHVTMSFSLVDSTATGVVTISAVVQMLGYDELFSVSSNNKFV